MSQIVLNAAEASHLRSLAVNAAQGLCKESLTFCNMLYKAQNGVVKIGREERPVTQAWGFESFEDWSEKELGYHHGTATAYARIFWSLFILCVDRWQEKDLPKSITKLKAVSRVMLPTTCQSWLKKAREMTCCQLDHAIKAHQNMKRQSKEVQTITFLLTTKQKARVRRIIEIAREEVDSGDRGDAVTMIFTQWAKAFAMKPKLRAVG